jgi:adenylosuccinate lyase
MFLAQSVHVQTDWVSLGVFIVSLLGVLGAIAGWVLKRIDKYTERLTRRLDKVDEHLAQQDVKIARIEGTLNSVKRDGRR